jgi:hypothetical protein
VREGERERSKQITDEQVIYDNRTFDFWSDRPQMEKIWSITAHFLTFALASNSGLTIETQIVAPN